MKEYQDIIKKEITTAIPSSTHLISKYTYTEQQVSFFSLPYKQVYALNLNV